MGEIVEALVDALDLLEQHAGFLGRHQPAAGAVEQAELQPVLHMAEHPAEAGLGRAEHPRGAADRLGNHDGAENFYLSNREHRTSMILHRMDSAC
jgi:hypothetical protein